MTNDLRICVLGIGEQGTKAVEYIKQCSSLPLFYNQTTEIDCMVIVSAIEDQHTVDAIIYVVGHYNSENQLALTIALKPQAYDIQYIQRVHKIKSHCCVIFPGYRLGTYSFDWPTQFKFATQIIDGLFSTFFQRQTIGFDFCELVDLLKKPEMLAIAFCDTFAYDFIKSINLDLVTPLKRGGIQLDANTRLFVNVILSKINMDDFFAVEEKLFQELFILDYVVCTTIESRLENEIGLFIVITNQELK